MQTPRKKLIFLFILCSFYFLSQLHIAVHLVYIFSIFYFKLTMAQQYLNGDE